MEFFQSEYSVALLLGAAIVLIFAVPVATRQWVWLWLIVILVAIGLGVNAYLTFTDFWPDRHGFLRMWAVLFTWPFAAGLVVRGLNTALERFAVRGFRILVWTITLLGLLVAVAPYASLFF